jgi:hypothetical protein
MAAVNEFSGAHIPRRRRRLWPRFESERDIDLHLRAVRKIVIGLVLFGCVFSGLVLWLSPDRFHIRFPDGPAVALISVWGTGFVLGLAAWLLPTRRSRVLAALIMFVAGSTIFELFSLAQTSVASKAAGGAVWGIVGWMGLGAIRGTWRWHAARGSRIDWGNTAIALAIPTIAATTLALLLLIVMLLLEEMSLILLDGEDETLGAVPVLGWMITSTVLAAVLTWHLPTVRAGHPGVPIATPFASGAFLEKSEHLKGERI